MADAGDDTRTPREAEPMSPDTWILRSRRVVTPDGVREASVTIRGEEIISVGRHEEAPDPLRVVDVGDRLVLPGLVDIHVHINDPGRADWEGFETATRAAAAGGITTLVDMPLNSDPVTTTVAALDAKRAAAVGRLRVDCGFFGGVVPGNADQIEPLAEAGVLGFKAFLCHSGIDEFPNATEADLLAAMPILARLGLPLLVHAELVPEGAPGMDASDPKSYAAWLASRPDAWEVDAIRLVIGLCRETGCRVHVVHLATGEALPLIADARAEGLPLTVETCPHYLTFAAEEIPDGDPRFKCAPPIRCEANRERLWQGLRDGLIDTIATDHSPAPPGLKHLDTGDLARAWGGIASLQVALPAVWTEARRRGFAPEDLARWMALRPAAIVGLGARKGAIAPGFDADFAVVEPDASFVVDASSLHHRHPATPYEGRTLLGRVVATYLRGREIADPTPAGRPLARTSEGLDRLNALDESAARAELLRCCGSRRWADKMAGLRPFATSADVLDAADRDWGALDIADRLEAFAAHPEIGDVEALRAKFATTAAWASGEQSGVAGASEATLRALAEGNRDYRARFGHIFIVCATGKTADEMLGLLRARLDNDPGAEREIASVEQAKITRIRLRKLLL
jgi:allantoinase